MGVINLCSPGHLDPFDSYGLIACELIRHLSEAGERVNPLCLGRDRHQNQTDEMAALIARPIMPAMGGIFLGYPTSYAKHSALAQSGPRVALSMFESSKIPATWPAIFNQMDAVIVPSRFCAQAFKRGGVTAPITVCPLGIGDAYKPAKRAQGRPLTFLAFLDRGERKGGLAAQQAFSLAFGDDPNVRLILKMRDRRVPQAILNENITLIQRDMTDQELYELYLSADVLINPNKGEGFGLIPREFAATGGVSLATDWSGTADELSAWGWPLPYTLEPALWDGNAKLSGLDLGVWARPDIPAIAKVLTGIAAKRASYARIAARKAKAAAELYSWRRFAAQVLAVYEEAKVGASHRADRALPEAA